MKSWHQTNTCFFPLESEARISFSLDSPRPERIKSSQSTEPSTLLKGYLRHRESFLCVDALERRWKKKNKSKWLRPRKHENGVKFWFSQESSTGHLSRMRRHERACSIVANGKIMLFIKQIQWCR